MRRIARAIVTGAWVLLAVVVGTIFRQNIEEAAAERGFSKLLSSGWRALIAQGWGQWLLIAFAVLTGAVVAIWAEYALRRWEARKRVDAKGLLRLTFENDRSFGKKDEGIEAVHVLDGRVLGSIYESDPKLSRYVVTAIIIFSQDLDDPCPYVFATRKAIWREAQSSSRYMAIEIDRLSKDDLTLQIVIRPLAWSPPGKHHEGPLKWHDTHTVEIESAAPSSAEESQPLSLPASQSETTPETRPG